jgi:hypothetical protein
MAKMNKADIQFKVDQLRKDKIVFGVESVAVTLMVTLMVSSLGFLGFMFPIVNEYAKLILQILLGSAVLIFLYVIVSNRVRCLKIRKLEKEL